MLPTRLERQLEDRLEHFMQPRIEKWLTEFFDSAQGKQLLSDLLADVLVVWMAPASSTDPGFFQDLVLNLVKRLKEQPDFRRRLIELLNPLWETPKA